MHDKFYALEVTGKDIRQIEAARASIPAGTPINIAFLGNEDHGQRINAARVIRTCGFEPVPIISSRRIRSQHDLNGLLAALIAEAEPRRFIFVGGDPDTPAGPYTDSISLLKSGVLHRNSIRHVGIVAYPEGHPKIETEVLWQALKRKAALFENEGCSVEITTQFGFDANAIVKWVKRLRDEGIDAPIRIGVPAPANAAKLLRFARQFGAITSAAIVRKYGISFANPTQHVGPERFFERILLGTAGRDLGTILYHLYPFGGIPEGVSWINRYMLDHYPASIRSA